ncbi:heavy metal translocating P-type ATPase [Dyadobacter tibetensis]|uniref:heavy metal translocating P-type ATPase n=1 Tax=Dyadobacter tibetensis TaxID=1211851 RepID=UPI0004702121|nr:heavy metal translocating P-type ATPase [Dyadobacter tibetensis]
MTTIHQKDEDTHQHNDAHNHQGIFGPYTELVFSVTCGALLALGYLLNFVENFPAWINLSLYLMAYFFGGFFTTKEAIETISKGRFEIDFLMLVAAVGAGILGEWAEGALLLFLFSLGHSLEHYAMGRARNSISSLADLAPPTAVLLKNQKRQEIPVNELEKGDTILIKPNSKIPADALVIKGSGPVDQSPITGESIPLEKVAYQANDDFLQQPEKYLSENRIFAGSINGPSALEARVLKVAQDSTIARLIRIVKEAEKQKSPTQRFTDRFEKYFVPSILILVVVLCFAFLVIDESFSSSFYRAMAVLVAASPCALAISTPSAVLSGVARAARGGVLIKGGRPLEDLGNIESIAFDKTGTLTEGKPKLTHSLPFDGFTEIQLLQYAVAVEQASDHPLATAIVKGATLLLKDSPVPQAEGLQSITGKGVSARIDQDQIRIGNQALFEGNIPKEILAQMTEIEGTGHTAMLVQKGDHWVGLLGLMDTPRAEAADVLKRLRSLGIRKMVMLTGDNQRVAETVARTIGISEVWGNLMPEDKVDAVARLDARENKVAMIGDGVNDAPAMAKSTVGIAMGAAGSDVALETADIALMGDQLSSLPFAIGLSREAKRIIKQNLWISLGMVGILIPLTILGIASIGPAVLAHEGSTLIVVFNALRLLTYQDKSEELPT